MPQLKRIREREREEREEKGRRDRVKERYRQREGEKNTRDLKYWNFFTFKALPDFFFSLLISEKVSCNQSHSIFLFHKIILF
jgi:hypothetical protein